MITQDIISHNLISPAVLFFALGLVAAWSKSDLKFPPALSESFSIYLLAAIGMKGGIELSDHSLHALIKPIAGTLLLGVAIPVITFAVCRWMRLDRKNAIALAATYGSVSIVTFGAAIAFLNLSKTPYESYMSAMVVLLESPAILVSLLMFGWLEKKSCQSNMGLRSRPSESFHSTPSESFHSSIQTLKTWIDPKIIKESLFGKSVLLMLGSLVIGLIVGKSALPIVKPLFIDLFQSILVLFLLGMGLLAGEHLAEIRKHGYKLIVLALGFPVIYGVLGILIGKWCGLSVGGITLMGVLGASASYIAAPAALRISVPEASPSIYLGMSIGITFPFNLAIGLPLYYQIAQWIH